MPGALLRPRTGPEIIDASVQLVREHPRPLLLLGVLLVIPGLVVNALNVLALGLDATTIATDGLAPLSLLLVVVGGLLATCWVCVAFGALTTAASAAYSEGQAPAPAEALRAASRRAGTLVGSGVLTYLLITLQIVAVALGVGLAFALVLGALGVFRGAAAGSTTGLATMGLVGVLAVIAGIVAMVGGVAFLVGRYFTLPVVVMAEGLGVGDAMRRARSLARGSMKRVTLLLVLVFVLFFAVAVGGVVLLTALVNPAVGIVAGTLLNVPLYTFLGALCTVLYYDLRIRGEGLDLERLVDELGDAPPGPHPGTPGGYSGASPATD